MNFFAPVEAFSNSVERGVAKLSQRAFEGTKRELPQPEPSRRQSTVKAIVDQEPSPEQIKEARDFGLAAEDDNGGLELTPLGELVLSGYPDDHPDAKAAAA
jgi:hypothetical protein